MNACSHVHMFTALCHGSGGPVGVNQDVRCPKNVQFHIQKPEKSIFFVLSHLVCGIFVCLFYFCFLSLCLWGVLVHVCTNGCQRGGLMHVCIHGDQRGRLKHVYTHGDKRERLMHVCTHGDQREDSCMCVHMETRPCLTLAFFHLVNAYWWNACVPHKAGNPKTRTVTGTQTLLQ